MPSTPVCPSIKSPYVDGTVYRTSGEGALDAVYDYRLLPSWNELNSDRLTYAKSFNIQQQNMDPITGQRLVEPYPNSIFVVQNPPSATADHAGNGRGGRTPLRAPLASRLRQRGRRAPRLCRGALLYIEPTAAALANAASARSPSIRVAFCRCEATTASCSEAERAHAHDPDFKGYINDVGGPTANFCRPACDKQLKHGRVQEPALPVAQRLQEHGGRSERLLRSSCATCARFPASRRSLSAAASALTTPWQTPRTNSCSRSWCSITSPASCA